MVRIRAYTAWEPIRWECFYQEYAYTVEYVYTMKDAYTVEYVYTVKDAYTVEYVYTVKDAYTVNVLIR